MRKNELVKLERKWSKTMW